MLTVDAITHLMISLLMLILFVVGIRQLRRKFNSYGLVILAVVAGLIYDNVILGIGGLIGYGDALKALNAPRFITHALLTPTMIIYAFGMARMTGFGWAQSKIWHAVFCVLATALIGFGSAQDIVGLQLSPYEAGSALTGYRNEFVLIKGPPIPAVVAILVIIVVGALQLWKARWGWLLAGGVLMFIGAMAMLRVPVLGNVGELALALTTITTWVAAEQGALNRVRPAISRPVAPAAADTGLRAPSPQRQAEADRKGRMRKANLIVGWFTLAGVILATLEEVAGAPATLGTIGKSVYFIGVFLHFFAGLYLYGVPVFKPNLRVVHMYAGFAVFLVTLVNRTVVNNAALASATWMIMWAPLAIHIALGVWFAVQRATGRAVNRPLTFYLGGNVIRDAT